MKLIQSSIKEDILSGPADTSPRGKDSDSIQRPVSCGAVQRPTQSCHAAADKNHFHRASPASGRMVGRESETSGPHKFLFIVTLRNAAPQRNLPTADIAS